MANFKFNYQVSMRRESDGKTVTRTGRRRGRVSAIGGLLIALGIGAAFFALFLPLAIGISLVGIGLLSMASLSRALLPGSNHKQLQETQKPSRNTFPETDSESKIVDAEYRMLDKDE